MFVTLEPSPCVTENDRIACVDLITKAKLLLVEVDAICVGVIVPMGHASAGSRTKAFFRGAQIASESEHDPSQTVAVFVKNAVDVVDG